MGYNIKEDPEVDWMDLEENLEQDLEPNEKIRVDPFKRPEWAPLPKDPVDDVFEDLPDLVEVLLGIHRYLCKFVKRPKWTLYQLGDFFRDERRDEMAERMYLEEEQKKDIEDMKRREEDSELQE